MDKRRISGEKKQPPRFFEEPEVPRPRKRKHTQGLPKKDYTAAEKEVKENLLLQNLGDSILQGLLKAFVADKPSAESSGASRNLSDVQQAMEIAEKMAVSREGIGQKRMCQITIGKDSVLSGTDIRIFQEGGVLQFQFFVRTDTAAQLLFNSNTVSNLQRFLQKRLKGNNINIDILDERGDEGDG